MIKYREVYNLSNTILCVVGRNYQAECAALRDAKTKLDVSKKEKDSMESKYNVIAVELEQVLAAWDAKVGCDCVKDVKLLKEELAVKVKKLVEAEALLLEKSLLLESVQEQMRAGREQLQEIVTIEDCSD